MVMYLMVLNNNIISSGFLEKVDINILKRMTVLWPVHVGCFILFILIITGVVTSVHDSVAFLSIFVLYPLFIAVVPCPYYYFKVAFVLEGAVKNRPEQFEDSKNTDRYVKWKRLAFISKFGGFFAILYGWPLVIFIIVGLFMNLYADPDMYFALFFVLVPFATIVSQLIIAIFFLIGGGCDLGLKQSLSKTSPGLPQVTSMSTAANPL